MNEKVEEALKYIPPNGFIKITKQAALDVSKEDRVKLIRKANDFFNQGQIALAKRIFIALGYGDGLIRLGDYYQKNNNFVDAIIMYHLAKDQNRVNQMAEQFARALQKWLQQS